MKNVFLAIMLALCAAGCGTRTQTVFESNPNFSDKNMAAALQHESAFCTAVSRGEGNAYAHIQDLPARDFSENFFLSARELGYTDRLSETRKSQTDYIAAYSFTPNASPLREEERAEACMRQLGWKTANELTRSDRLRLNKNNRAETLIEKIRQDPLSDKCIKIMAANMALLSRSQAAQEKNHLFTDPGVFEYVYMRARSYVAKNEKEVDSRILASSIGIDFARCSAMYGVVNEKRQNKLKHEIEVNDRLLKLEHESFYYASRLLHAETAYQEKRAYAREFQREAGPNLSGIMLRFKEESSQCATLLQRFKLINSGELER